MNVVDALRGDRAARPLANTTSAAGLRAQLEDGIYEFWRGKDAIERIPEDQIAEVHLADG